MLPSDERVARFDRTERWVHRSVAVLTGVCVATAAVLYLDPLSALVGMRPSVSWIHYVSGLLIPVPLILGFARSRSMRLDVRRLNRFHDRDWQWLRSRDRRGGAVPVGKFNAGQKLNAAFTLGAVIILVGTGLMLHYFSFFPDDIRTGATLVYDTIALAVVVVLGGHLWQAGKHPEARIGMRTGAVSRDYAEREHPLWLAESEPREDPN